MQRFFPYILYCCSVLLVVAYVNLFDLWAWLNNHLEKQILDILPIGITLFVLGALIVMFSRVEKQYNNLDRRYFFGGIALCLLALCIPDARYAVKRIHVVEYLSLSLLIRYAMSYRLQGRSLFYFSLLATVLLGIHDELLQGIHSSRTYGLRDMTVNAVAAAGGSMIWQSIFLFNKTKSIVVEQPATGLAQRLYLSWLFFAVIALIVPMTGYRYQTIPYWPLLPLAAAPALYFLNCSRRSGTQHGIMVVNMLSFSMLVYPVFINVFSITFR